MKVSVVAVAIVASALLVKATPDIGPSTTASQTSRIPIFKSTSNLRKVNSSAVDFVKLEGHLAQLRAKYQRSLDSFKANTGVEHPLRVALPTSRQGTGKVPLRDVSDELWVGKIAFGTPAQTIPIDFDTGSADTLVNPGAYSPGKSSTSVKTSQKFSTAYGDGTTAEGIVFTDKLSIGGLKASRVAIGLSDFTFMKAEEHARGIAGMSFPQLATFGSKYPPFIDSLHQAGALSAFEFSFKLGSHSSELILGGYDSADIIGKPTWVPVDSAKGFWQVSAKVNGWMPIQSIVDTGTTAIVAPPFQVIAFLLSIGLEPKFSGQTVYGSYDCSKPPTVSITYGGKNITLDEESMSLGTDDSNKCVLSVLGEDVGIDAWITGDNLLRNTLAIFDRANSRVGFGTRAAGPQ